MPSLGTRNAIYYGLKPFLPRALRMHLRRWHAMSVRERYKSVWPIDDAAANPPHAWKGWPDGKAFAVVLTHDVEGPRGLARVKRLAEVEMSAGFRSSFNFIPRGTYSVPPDLRQWLTAHDFEVGVHDLHHDGHLFSSRRSFEKYSTQINAYLREWNAVGFRSGFMRRNLDWIHQLEIEYDASTFDTDPFEPEPNGARTIFPFWIPAPTQTPPPPSTSLPDSASDRPLGANASSNRGYVEMPYTLAQDSTLFLVLRERDISIWRRKVDWLAEKGGMALVNVHPDYIRFDDDPPDPHTFPVARYRELLAFFTQAYADRHWKCLPKEAAALFRPSASC